MKNKGTKRVVNVVAKNDRKHISMKIEVLFSANELMREEQQQHIDDLKDQLYQLLEPSFHYSQIMIV